MFRIFIAESILKGIIETEGSKHQEQATEIKEL